MPPPNEREALLITYLRQQLGEVIGLNANAIGFNQRLFDLGLDSLMALELRTVLEQDLDCTLHATLLFDYPTLQRLSDYIAEDILALEVEGPTEEAEHEEISLQEALATMQNTLLMDEEHDSFDNEEEKEEEENEEEEEDEEDDEMAKLLAEQLGLDWEDLDE